MQSAQAQVGSLSPHESRHRCTSRGTRESKHKSVLSVEGLGIRVEAPSTAAHDETYESRHKAYESRRGTRHTSRGPRHTSRHTSRGTRHTSRGTRHTSRGTKYTSRGTKHKHTSRRTSRGSKYISIRLFIGEAPIRYEPSIRVEALGITRLGIRPSTSGYESRHESRH